MYCGGCLRDNALVAALRKLGHQVLMVPLYLPLTLDEAGPKRRHADLLRRHQRLSGAESRRCSAARRAGCTICLPRARLLQWAAGKAAKTRAADLGELTLSMLRGEAGNQARETRGTHRVAQDPAEAGRALPVQRAADRHGAPPQSPSWAPRSPARCRAKTSFLDAPAREPSRGVLANAGRTGGGGGPVRRAQPVFRRT